MKATVEIAGVEMVVEYDYDITTHGNNGHPPSLNHPGDPPEAAEFEIEVLSLRHDPQAADIPDLELPKWLKELLEQHLSERDDINDVVQVADQNRDYEDYDSAPDYD